MKLYEEVKHLFAPILPNAFPHRTTLYQQIENALRNHSSTVTTNGKSEEMVHMTIRQVMRDNPDIFWFSHQWHYSEENSEVQFHYTIDKGRSEKIKKQIKDVVINDFKLEFVQTLPVVERVMYVYKWIALYCNYNVRSAQNQTIYSVFVLRSSVCTGIAKAAQYLLQKVGIESRLVFGKMNNSAEDSRHCWLVINVSGSWYHLDPTFAMPETRELLTESGVEPIIGRGEDPLLYNYFCVDTDTIKLSRSIEEENLLPECSSSIDYKLYQGIDVAVSRNGNEDGLGCILSDTGTTADIYLAHIKGNNRLRSVAKVYRNDSGHELLKKELIVMREHAGSHLLIATDTNSSEDVLYMEQATPLTELLSSHYYKMTVKDFCNLLLDIASGWRELYAHGIIYRDIHLNNIYLSDTQINGRYIYKLGDFGSCTFIGNDERYKGLTQQGGIGSKWYMAPETWKNGAFDERSAVYGVGMIAYYLLNDLYPPFWSEMNDSSFEFRMKGFKLPLPSRLRDEEYKHLNIPFIEKSLEFEPSERYESLPSLIADIERFLSQSQAWENKFIVKGGQFKEIHKTNRERFCSTCIIDPSIEVSNGERFWESDKCDSGKTSDNKFDNASRINDFACTCGGCFYNSDDNLFEKTHIPSEDITFFGSRNGNPGINSQINDRGVGCAPQNRGHNISYEPDSRNKRKTQHLPHRSSLWPRIFTKQYKPQTAYGSIFAPSEVMRKQNMLVQVYLHLAEETETVKSLAVEADRNAERRGYEPLEVRLKNRDNIEIELNINGRTLLYNERKSVVWQGTFVKRAFNYIIPDNIDISELSCSVNIFINGAIAGELIFLTRVVEYNLRQLNTDITARPTRRLFISYSHKDIKSAEKIAKIHEALGIDVFFDKHRLKAGYIYSEEISKFIQTADTFVLCWSKNAAESDYVEKERQEALALAYPQCKPREQATLKIHPYDIEPHTTPPADMIENYHFEEL